MYLNIGVRTSKYIIEQRMVRKRFIPSLLTLEELAEYLGLQKQTIYNWLNQRKISGIKIGKVWRFERKEIDRWISECKSATYKERKK